MRQLLLAPAAALLLCVPAGSQPARAQPAAQPVRVVAAENFYGDLAQQLAGPHARVSSILSNPDEDPHLFEASPSVARDISAARIVVSNGVDYDPWMAKLLAAARNGERQSIVVADLVHAQPGGNPHLWYDPATMPAAAQALSAALTAADPADKADYDARLQRVLASLKPIDAKVAELKAKYAGTPVTATEPVFGLMAAALGLDMRNQGFQLAVMNNTEPSASDTAAMEADLRGHKVRLFIYNSQATDTAAQRLLKLAHTAHVPVIGVTETEPKGRDYQQWMLGQLDALDKALSGPTS
jgi:zinc/manganese transport system substrate-binding protein